MKRTSIGKSAGGLHRRLLKAAQQGDLGAEEHLVRRYEPLVRRVVWNLRPPLGCEREDLAQEARIGLLAAIRAWRPERGPFPAFAERCVSNQALLAVKAAARHKHQLLARALSLESEHGGHASTAGEHPALRLFDTLALRDARSDPEARLLVGEQLTSVVAALPTLTPSERNALARTLAGESYERLAPDFGTAKAASQAAYRARRKLATALRSAA
jgi:RNA polymerase sporulation-specific sigma factor